LKRETPKKNIYLSADEELTFAISNQLDYPKHMLDPSACEKHMLDTSAYRSGLNAQKYAGPDLVEFTHRRRPLHDSRLHAVRETEAWQVLQRQALARGVLEEDLWLEACTR
jgi:hypothetical protein